MSSAEQGRPKSFAEAIIGGVKGVTSVAASLAVLAALGQISRPKSALFAPEVTAPAVLPRLDLRGILTPRTVSENALPVVADNEVCRKKGTTRDAKPDVHALDPEAANQLFRLINAATGQKTTPTKNLPIFDGINPYSGGTRVTVMTGGTERRAGKAEPQIAYIDVLNGSFSGQALVFDEANPPSGSKDPTCKEPHWVIALKEYGFVPSDKGISFANKLGRFAKVVSGAGGFQQRIS